MKVKNNYGIICDNCGFEFERYDKIDKKYYGNFYGAYCPNCNNFIKPDKKPSFISEYELKLINLRNEMLKRIKKRIFKEK